MKTTDILNKVYFDDNISIVVKNIINTISKKYPFVDIGRNRAVFRLSENNVIKIPINYDGFADNEYESRSKKDVEYGIPKTRLFCTDDIPILVMEYIEHTFLDSYPEWAMFIDCFQIGYNKKGQLLAYDLA